MVSGKTLALFSTFMALITILFFRQYAYPLLVDVYYNIGPAGIVGSPVPSDAVVNLGYSLGFLSPVYAALLLVLLWGNRQTGIYAFYYYKRLYLIKIVFYSLLYSLGFIALVLLYMISAIGDVWSSLIIVGSFIADIVFILVIYSTLNIRINYFLSLSIVFMLARFFSIPQKSLWFSSLPLAASYTVMGQVGSSSLVSIILLYYLVAFVIYWRGAKE